VIRQQKLSGYQALCLLAVRVMGRRRRRSSTRCGTHPARPGVRRKVRYVLTRRGLLSFVEYLPCPFGLGASVSSRRAVREALLRYYVGRQQWVCGGLDRQVRALEDEGKSVESKANSREQNRR
jgi:hypothetical protein